jgi:hypothetical protein
MSVRRPVTAEDAAAAPPGRNVLRRNPIKASGGHGAAPPVPARCGRLRYR